VSDIAGLGEEAAGESPIGAAGAGLRRVTLDGDELVGDAHGELASHVQAEARTFPTDATADLAAVKLISGAELIGLGQHRIGHGEDIARLGVDTQSFMQFEVTKAGQQAEVDISAR